MIFHKKIEDIYRSMVFVRYDDTGIFKYFSHKDFNGLCAEPYSFESSKGHRLQGYFYSSEGYDNSRLVIFEHGFGGGHLSYMKEIERLCSGGYRVFAYDHTGCMESGGESTGGFSQSLCDLNDCINALKADKEINTEDISVVGHSWGGLSTLNISALHPDIKRIVVLSGAVSVKKMTEQNFSGILKGYRKHILALERASNPNFIDYDAVETLKKFEGKALLIYSDNDQMIKKEVHYDALHSAFADRDNIELWLVSCKGHNVNYTADAVAYIGDFAALMKKAQKLKTAEEKENFRNSVDWEKMTEQDNSVWAKIFDFLK